MVERLEPEEQDWEVIREFLPPRKRTGRPGWHERKLLNGMYGELRSGGHWRDMPERAGPWQTVYHRCNPWQEDGAHPADPAMRRTRPARRRGCRATRTGLFGQQGQQFAAELVHLVGADAVDGQQLVARGGLLLGQGA